jgi:hypothetical protein
LKTYFESENMIKGPTKAINGLSLIMSAGFNPVVMLRTADKRWYAGYCE